MKPICKLCFKNLTKEDLTQTLVSTPSLCRECFSKLNYAINHEHLDGVEVTSLANYEEPLSQLLVRFKQMRDYEIGDIFLERYIPYIVSKYFSYYLVLVPSSPHKKAFRGFDHLIKMTENLPLKRLDVFIKRDGLEQKSKNKKDRISVKDEIVLIKPDLIEGKKVLIFDDVMTSGASLKACISSLKKAGARKIKALVLLRDHWK